MLPSLLVCAPPLLLRAPVAAAAAARRCCLLLRCRLLLASSSTPELLLVGVVVSLSHPKEGETRPLRLNAKTRGKEELTLQLTGFEASRPSSGHARQTIVHEANRKILTVARPVGSCCACRQAVEWWGRSRVGRPAALRESRLLRVAVTVRPSAGGRAPLRGCRVGRASPPNCP